MSQIRIEGPHRRGIPSPKPEFVNRRWTDRARAEDRYQWPVNLKVAAYSTTMNPSRRGYRGKRTHRRGAWVPPNERFANQPLTRRERRALVARRAPI